MRGVRRSNRGGGAELCHGSQGRVALISRLQRLVFWFSGRVGGLFGRVDETVQRHQKRFSCRYSPVSRWFALLWTNPPLHNAVPLLPLVRFKPLVISEFQWSETFPRHDHSSQNRTTQVFGPKVSDLTSLLGVQRPSLISRKKDHVDCLVVQRKLLGDHPSPKPSLKSVDEGVVGI